MPLLVAFISFIDRQKVLGFFATLIDSLKSALFEFPEVRSPQIPHQQPQLVQITHFPPYFQRT
jgi:hypothetical protein